MSLEAKLDELIPVFSKLIDTLVEHKAVMQQAIGGDAGAVAAGGAASSSTRTRKKADEKAAPTNDQASVKEKFEAIKSKFPASVPDLKKIIADVGKSATLAELLTKPDNYDAVFDALSALETDLAKPAAADEDDL